MEAKEFNAMVARNIRFLREERGLSVEELATMIGSMSRSLITKIEHNAKNAEHKKRIDTSHIEWIANALGVNIDVILETNEYINLTIRNLKNLVGNMHVHVKSIDDEEIQLFGFLLQRTSFRGPREQTEALLLAGELSYNLGDSIDAIKYFDIALHIACNTMDSEMILIIKHQLSRALFMIGKYNELHELLERDIEIFKSPDHERNAKILLLRGMAYAKQKLWENAISHMQEAIKEAQQCPKQNSFEGRCFQALGAVYRDVKKFDESLDASLRAIQICRSAIDRIGEIYGLKTIGEVYYEQGLYNAALENYYLALNLSEEIVSFQEIDTLKIRYSIAKCKRELDHMINLVEKLQTFSLPPNDIAEMYVDIARVSIESSNNCDAHKYCEKAIQLLQR